MSSLDNKYSAEIARLRSENKRLRTLLRKSTPGLEALLSRRGFKIYKKEPLADVLISPKSHLEKYYALMHRYSFRLFLREVIKRRDCFTLSEVTRYATAAVTNTYLLHLLSFKLIRKKGDCFAVTRPGVRSFGETLEWYVAELFRREFGAEVVWGVKFRRPRVGGDYDVIARIDSSLFYLEVKSSPPKQIYDTEIAAFLDRVEDLCPEIAVFLMDTELRMKDKIVPLFEAEIARRSSFPPQVERMERELFHINGRIFIINAREDISDNIKKVFSSYYGRLGKAQLSNEKIESDN